MPAVIRIIKSLIVSRGSPMIFGASALVGQITKNMMLTSGSTNIGCITDIINSDNECVNSINTPKPCTLIVDSKLQLVKDINVDKLLNSK